MRFFGRLAALCTLAFGGLAAAPSLATPTNTWMTEEAMRGAFIGKTLDGHYIDGLRWTETYDADGRLDYRERARNGLGHWYFRSHVFCTFYDPGYGLNGGCWTAIMASAKLLRVLYCRSQPRPARGRSRTGTARRLGGARLAQGRTLDVRRQAQCVTAVGRTTRKA